MELWWWRYGAPVPPEFAELLDAEERERAEAFRFPAHSARFVWARAMTKSVVGAAAGVPAREVELVRHGCAGCGGRNHGKPSVRLRGAHTERLPGTPEPPETPEISLSHSEGYSALLLSRRHAVGLDIERVRPMPVDVLSGTTLSAAERGYLAGHAEGMPRSLAYLRCWTRKEAVLKASGTGVQGDLTALEVRPAQEGASVRHALGDSAGSWSVRNVRVTEDLLAAVAGPAGTDRTVSVRRADRLFAPGT